MNAYADLIPSELFAQAIDAAGRGDTEALMAIEAAAAIDSTLPQRCRAFREAALWVGTLALREIGFIWRMIAYRDDINRGISCSRLAAIVLGWSRFSEELGASPSATPESAWDEANQLLGMNAPVQPDPEFYRSVLDALRDGWQQNIGAPPESSAGVRTLN